MRGRWLWIGFVIGIVAVLSLASAVTLRIEAQSIARPDVLSKIAPWVLDRTANGQSAEFLIVLADQADLSRAQEMNTQAKKGRYVYATLLGKAQATQGSLLLWLKAHGAKYRSFYIVNAIWAQADRSTVLALANRSDVARIEGNPLIQNNLDRPAAPSGLRPNDLNGIEPGLAYVHAPDVWALGFKGQGIVVGGQDTGYQWDHPALKPHYRGWNGTTASHDYNWHDSIHSNMHGINSCGFDSPVPCDDYGHGTHTMGTVLGDDGGANRTGMAPGAQWIGCRNMDNGYGTPASYLECFEFFLAPYPVNGTPAQGDPSKAPDVTNNSWSCPVSEGCSPNTLLAAVQAQRAAGILTVASASNDGPACSSVAEPIALYAESYTVGALINGLDVIASFSSRGPVTIDGSGRRKPDISAPGTSVRSSWLANTYTYLDGTSMAAPHVAGAVALLWSARPELKHDITASEQLLDNTAVPIASNECGSNGWPNNTYGYGRLDILAPMYGVQVSPATIAHGGNPGTPVDYTLWITNAAVTTDTLMVRLGSHQWNTTASSLTTRPLAAGASVRLTITVDVPFTATAYVSDTVSVTVASQAYPTRTDTAVLTTQSTAVFGAILSPSALTKVGFPGLPVNYTLDLTNTGNLRTEFFLDLTGLPPSWSSMTKPAPITLTPGAGEDVSFSFSIPASASQMTANMTVTVSNNNAGNPVITHSMLTTTVVIPRKHYMPLVFAARAGQ